MDSKIYYKQESFPLDYYNIILYYDGEIIGEFFGQKGDNLLLKVEDFLRNNNINIRFDELIPL